MAGRAKGNGAETAQAAVAVAMAAGLARMDRHHAVLFASPALIGLSLAGSATAIEQERYRVGRPMSSLSATARVGPYGEKIRGSAEQADFSTPVVTVPVQYMEFSGTLCAPKRLGIPAQAADGSPARAALQSVGEGT